MNPGVLLAPSSPFGFPAPYWFLALFKLIGFILHMTMMHLWYAGPILGFYLWARGGNARIFSKRLMMQMPIIVALGVNFGIVPLLFVQVAYYKVFYPSTILMAWPWLSVIILLTVAYYGVYIYASAIKNELSKLTPFKRAAGWIAALLFIIIGFIFSNEFSLMTNLEAWQRLWSESNIAGASLGLALNISDSTFWPRWLMMFGMALMSASAYIAIDSSLLAAKESAVYRRWAVQYSFKPYLVGLVWYFAMAAWYIFGTWPDDIKNLMLGGSWLILTILTAALPLLTFLLLLAVSRKDSVSRGQAIMIGLSQIMVLALNGIGRQVVQNAEIGRYLDIAAEPVRTQWSPLVLFLLLFVVGVGIIIWMLRQLPAAGQKLTT